MVYLLLNSCFSGNGDATCSYQAVEHGQYQPRQGEIIFLYYVLFTAEWGGKITHHGKKTIVAYDMGCTAVSPTARDFSVVRHSYFTRSFIYSVNMAWAINSW